MLRVYNGLNQHFQKLMRIWSILWSTIEIERFKDLVTQGKQEA